MPRYFDIFLLLPRGAFTQLTSLECIKLILPTSTLPTPLAPLEHNRHVLSHSLLRGREKTRFASLRIPTTNMSGHLANIASNPSLDQGTFRQLPQLPPPVLDEVPINSWSPDIYAHTINAQVDAKARLLVVLGALLCINLN